MRDQRVVSTARMSPDCSFCQGYGQSTTATVNLDTTFTYNNEGKINSMTYPSTVAGSTTTPGPSYNYSYDSMYRFIQWHSGSEQRDL
ncbi:MAG: hypothetical protein ABSE57_25705 [Bryobacteraceae bacterium]